MSSIRKLKAEEIECRVAQVSAKGCSLLLYKTARVDRAILDEHFGSLWQNDFKILGGKMYGGIGIYNKELNQWLWRWDCGTESNTEAEKGQASDCFKRAGFKWGIGIELYSAPFIWLNVETQKDGDKYKLVNKFAKYNVNSIGYSDNGNINDLVITDDKGKEVFNMNKKTYNNQSSKQEIDPDTDLLLGLEETISTDEAFRYYKANVDNAKDTEAFKQAYKIQWSKLKLKEGK